MQFCVFISMDFVLNSVYVALNDILLRMASRTPFYVNKVQASSFSENELQTGLVSGQSCFQFGLKFFAGQKRMNILDQSDLKSSYKTF